MPTFQELMPDDSIRAVEVHEWWTRGWSKWQRSNLNWANEVDNSCDLLCLETRWRHADQHSTESYRYGPSEAPDPELDAWFLAQWQRRLPGE